MPAFQDLSGQTFGRLKVIKRVEDQISASGKHKTQYLCECSCPAHNRIIVTQSHLKDGHTSSCGCLNSELSSQRLKERSEGIGVTHGKYQSGIYKSYDCMVNRCIREDNPRYKGRGITICDEWYNPNRGNRFDLETFRNFYNWSMMNGYEDGKTIDRIDNDGPYAPWNCRWVYPNDQNNNKSTNHYVQFNNDSFSIAQLANVLGINYDAYYNILRYNDYNPYNPMQPVMTPYGFPVNAYFDWMGNQIPMNCIYFIDQYGFPVSEQQYAPPAPMPALWACDDKGFITGPILD